MKFLKTVLVAEDMDINFMLIEELLIDMDINVIHVMNGEEAVEACRTNPDIDLVLMDIRMPIMDGHTATKLIKGFLPNLPIIAQSACSLEEQKTESDEIYDDYIVKPIYKDDLTQKVMKYINEEI